MASELDLQALSLDELRAERNRLQHEDDAVSYVRRIAQARLDLVAAELRQSGDNSKEDLSGELQRVLSQHLTGPPSASRAPQPTTTIWQMTLEPSNLINSVPNTGSTAFHRGRTNPSRTHLVDECAYQLRTRDLNRSA